MGPQRVGHDWATEQPQQLELKRVADNPVSSYMVYESFVGSNVAAAWFRHTQDFSGFWISLFILQIVLQSSSYLTVACQAPPSWDFLGKNIGVGCHFLLQGIFLIRGSNLGLLHCRQTLYCLSHQGILEISKYKSIFDNVWETTN